MRFLASDLDGTLVDFDDMIPGNLEGIRSLKEAGHKFIISTGRSYNAVKRLIKKYEIDFDYLVLCNGGLIINKDNETVYDEWISKELAEKIAKEYYNKDLAMMFIHNLDKSFLIKNPNISEEKTSKVLNKFQQSTELISVDEVNESYKIMSLVCLDKDCNRAEKIKDSIIDKFGEDVQAFRNQYFIDIVPKGCSKGEALLRVLELEGESADNLYVIGDSFNDVSMFNITKNSFTFNRAEEEVKGYASELVDYVYEVVNKMI